MNYLDSRPISTPRRVNFARVFIHASNIYRLFFSWSNAVVLIALVELRQGVWRVVCPPLRLQHKAMRYAGFGAAAIVVFTSTLKYGMVVYLNKGAFDTTLAIGTTAVPTGVQFAQYPPAKRAHMRLQETCLDLSTTGDVVSLVAGLAVAGQAITVMARADFHLSVCFPNYQRAYFSALISPYSGNLSEPSSFQPLPDSQPLALRRRHVLPPHSHVGHAALRGDS
jgi:hypothetical protein